MNKLKPSEQELIKLLVRSKEAKEFQKFVAKRVLEGDSGESSGKKVDQLLLKSLDEDIRKRASEFLQELTEFGLLGSDNGVREEIMQKVCKRLYRRRRRILQDLEGFLPLREDLARRLIGLLYRKISNSKVVRAPLMVGPPGTGKSFAVEALVKTLNKNGIRTELIRRTLVSGEEAVKELGMYLLGTEVYYSNAFPGTLARMVARKDVDLVVVFLDELEKGLPHVYPLLLNLLDPAQPLEDRFLQGVFAGYGHDLRFKTFFVAAANDHKPIFEIPEIKDRFESPLMFKPYSAEEKIELVLKLFPREFGQTFRRRPKEEVRKIAQEVVRYSQLSLRDILSLVEDRLLEQKLSGYQAALPSAKMSKGRSLGFQVG